MSRLATRNCIKDEESANPGQDGVKRWAKTPENGKFERRQRWEIGFARWETKDQGDGRALLFPVSITAWCGKGYSWSFESEMMCIYDEMNGVIAKGCSRNRRGSFVRGGHWRFEWHG